MSAHQSVKLQSNGDYWIASWYDSRGDRCRKSIGAKSKLSKLAATERCEQLQAEFKALPARRDRRVPGLRQFLVDLLEARTDLELAIARNHVTTVKLLAAWFHPKTRVDEITRDQAREWRRDLARGDLHDGHRPARATVDRHVRNAKFLLDMAVGMGLATANSFDKLPGSNVRDLIRAEIRDLVLEIGSESLPRRDNAEYRSARWFYDKSKKGVSANALQMARKRGAVEGRRVSGHWQYTIASVSRHCPQYADQFIDD